MTKLHPSEYADEDVFGWERMFGTDTLCPPDHEYAGYPYWVEYMPEAKRREYMSLVSPHEFTDTMIYTREHMIELYGEEYEKYVNESADSAEGW